MQTTATSGRRGALLCVGGGILYPHVAKATTGVTQETAPSPRRWAAAALGYPSTIPGGPPSAATSAEKYSPAALGMFSSSWAGLHWPVLAA